MMRQLVLICKQHPVQRRIRYSFALNDIDEIRLDEAVTQLNDQ